MPTLTRDYIIEGLIQNAEIALGRRKTSITRIVVVKGADGLQTIKAASLTTYQRDGATANRALELLSKELDRREGKGETDAQADQSDAPAAKRNPALAEAIRKFREVARLRVGAADGEGNGDGSNDSSSH